MLEAALNHAYSAVNHPHVDGPYGIKRHFLIILTEPAIVRFLMDSKLISKMFDHRMELIVVLQWA